MKKLLIIFVSLFLMLCGCSSKKEDEESDNSGIEVEKELFDVTITIPSSFYESFDTEVTQENLDEQYSGDGYKSATLNDDGSVTIIMTKSQHKAMMEEMKNDVVSSIQEIVDDEDYSVEKIDYNKDFTEFTVTLNGEEVGMMNSFIVMALDIYGAMYNIFNGTDIDNIKTIFKNTNGDVIEEYNSNEISN